MADMARWCL